MPPQPLYSFWGGPDCHVRWWREGVFPCLHPVTRQRNCREGTVQNCRKLNSCRTVWANCSHTEMQSKGVLVLLFDTFVINVMCKFTVVAKTDSWEDNSGNKSIALQLFFRVPQIPLTWIAYTSRFPETFCSFRPLTFIWFFLCLELSWAPVTVQTSKCRSLR